MRQVFMKKNKWNMDGPNIPAVFLLFTVIKLKFSKSKNPLVSL